MPSTPTTALQILQMADLSESCQTSYPISNTTSEWREQAATMKQSAEEVLMLLFLANGCDFADLSVMPLLYRTYAISCKLSPKSRAKPCMQQWPSGCDLGRAAAPLRQPPWICPQHTESSCNCSEGFRCQAPQIRAPYLQGRAVYAAEAERLRAWGEPKRPSPEAAAMELVPTSAWLCLNCSSLICLYLVLQNMASST